MSKEEEVIFIVEESPEGGVRSAFTWTLDFIEAESFEELRTMVHDAVFCHFNEDERHRIIRLHLVREELIPV